MWVVQPRFVSSPFMVAIWSNSYTEQINFTSSNTVYSNMVIICNNGLQPEVKATPKRWRFNMRDLPRSHGYLTTKQRLEWGSLLSDNPEYLQT
jgi:hypothetical protein